MAESRYRPFLRMLAALSVGFLLLAILSVFDHALNAILHKGPETPFSPSPSHLRYQTPEFSYTARANSSGFRDHEFSKTKKGPRIIAIGDSFTFGWGVESGQAWPKVLEKALGVEVLNLGVPGYSPKNYAELVETTAPSLEPDLILVAVLQGDDLAQLTPPPRPSVNQRLSKEPRPVAGLLAKAYPSLFGYLRRRAHADFSLKSVWQRQAGDVQTELSASEHQRYLAMDEHVRHLFDNGLLNPALVQLAIVRPDYFRITLDLNRPEIKAMAQYFARIRRVASRIGCKLIIVPVPYGIYIDSRDLQTRRRIGFLVSDTMLTSRAPDDAIKTAAELAGVEFHSVTEAFRSLPHEPPLFYEYDGHFTSEGQRRFASLLELIAGSALSPHDSPDQGRGWSPRALSGNLRLDFSRSVPGTTSLKFVPGCGHTGKSLAPPEARKRRTDRRNQRIARLQSAFPSSAEDGPSYAAHFHRQLTTVRRTQRISVVAPPDRSSRFVRLVDRSLRGMPPKLC